MEAFSPIMATSASKSIATLPIKLLETVNSTQIYFKVVAIEQRARVIYIVHKSGSKFCSEDITRHYDDADDYELVIPLDNSYGALKNAAAQLPGNMTQDHLWGGGSQPDCEANFTGTLGLLECQVM